MHHLFAPPLRFAFLALAAFPAAAQNQAWVRQLGGFDDDGAFGAASDGSGGVFMTGFTANSLGGPYLGAVDAWLARYDHAGNQTWVRQVGSSGMDIAYAAASDGAGGVYMTGGQTNGNADLWLARYDGAGNELWFRQFGTPSLEYSWSVASDGSGGVYATGFTTGNMGGPSAGQYDAWLAHYDGAGNQLWIRQFGTSLQEQPRAAAPDASGGVYVSGYTTGNLGGPNAGATDVWVAHYDGAGNQTWVRQVGSSTNDFVYAAAPDRSGGVYVGGYSLGNLGGPNAGGADAWLAHFDSAGNQIWSRQFGTGLDEVIGGMASDASGGVYVTGSTDGSLGGPSAGGIDVWLAHYDGAGNQSWIRQMGGSADDYAWAAAPDGSGGVFATGETWSSLGMPNAGDSDILLLRYDGPCPTPATYCTAKVNSAGCTPSIGWSGTATATGPIDDFHVNATNVLNQKPGLMLWSTLPASMPFGGGTLCLAPPMIRTQGQSSGGSPAPASDCTGQYAFHFDHAYLQSFSLAAGQRIHAQYWSRDPGFAAPNKIGLTNALSFVICP